MRKNQLVLIDTRSETRPDARPDYFRLDDRTRELGRHGVAAAREALRRANAQAA